LHKIEIEAQIDLLSENKRLAEKNREFLRKKGIKAINIMGAIGSGKTLLIEKTIDSLPEIKFGVILGDVICRADFERVRKHDARVEPINTGKECHLDAHLISHVIEGFDGVDIILIENVGNLVCPVDFDLGEDYRVVMVSVTEGDDVVEKHPEIFRLADVIIINKISLADAVEADIDKMERDARRINGRALILKTDLRDGRGLNDWLNFVRRLKQK
jgi:hydrogenase nickel incorporation protein HypB